MNDQYYTADPSSASKPVECAFEYRGHPLVFTTDAGVFSKGELDTGTRLLIDALPEDLTGTVLDLGCGWGPVGISMKKHWPDLTVVMADVNRRALDLSRTNAKRNGTETECVESDGFAALAGRTFDAVVTNPPIRAGKQVIYRMFADSAAALSENGELYLVIRKQQGGDSAIAYLKTLFESVEKISKSGGFWVIRAAKAIHGKEERLEEH